MKKQIQKKMKRKFGALEELLYLTLSFTGMFLLVLLIAGGFWLCGY